MVQSRNIGSLRILLSSYLLLCVMFLSQTFSFRPRGTIVSSFTLRRMLSTDSTSTRIRQFQSLPPPSTGSNVVVHHTLRILQFNVLADGLSGLRPDLGAFSRVQKTFMMWESRKHRLLDEILQYDPDVVTLQECDHYHDFFLPELISRGYSGHFVPKPASVCLEVADRSDGCAIFYKNNVLRAISSQTLTYSLSKVDTLPDEEKTSKAVKEEDKQRLPQNQVALLLLCELVDGDEVASGGRKLSKGKKSKPPVLIATTHLKASKNAEGERYRHLETMQLLQAIEEIKTSFTHNQTYKPPGVIFAGDLNASPQATSATFGFNCTVYNLIKQHPSNYRSVLNDDLLQYRRGENSSYTEDEIWTTWKARRKQKKAAETVVRHCIDYIMYAPLSNENADSDGEEQVGVRAAAVLDGFRDLEVGQALLPNACYPSDHIAIAADLQIVERVVQK